MNMTTFSPKIYPQTKRSAGTLSVSAGFAQLRSLADLSRVKAYILDYEALVLILLAVFLIAGTFFYVDFQPFLPGASGPNQNSASSKLAEAPIQQPLNDELSRPIATEASSNTGLTPSSTTSIPSNPLDQPTGLISPGKRDHQLVHRRAIHHRHRR